MPQIKVGLGTVLGNIDFAVLVGTHSSRVNIYVRVKFLRRNFKPAHFKQSPERGGGYTFPKPRNNSSGYKNIFSHILSSVICKS